MINTAKKYLGIDSKGKADLMEYYNKNVYPLIEPNRKYKIKLNDQWCAMFCSVIAHKNGLKVNQFPYEVSVFYMTQKAQKMGLKYVKYSDMRVNDLVIYDWKDDGTLNHVGIIQEIGKDYIKVLEGNYSDTVKVRTLKYPNREIECFIRVPEIVDIELLAREVIQGKYGTGETRKKILGENYAEVQKRVTEILK